MAPDEDEVLAVRGRNLPHRDLHRPPAVLDVGAEPDPDRLPGLAHFLELQPRGAGDSDARDGRHLGGVVLPGRVAPDRLHRAEGDRLVLGMSPVHHDRAGRALETGDPLLLVARRRVRELRERELPDDVLPLVVFEAPRGHVDEIAADAVREGLEAVTEGVGLDRGLDRGKDAELRLVREADEARQFVHHRLDADLAQRIAAVLRHPAAVLRAGEAGGDLVDDVLDVGPDVVGRELLQDQVFGHPRFPPGQVCANSNQHNRRSRQDSRGRRRRNAPRIFKKL